MQRMATSNILLYGMGGLGVEIGKHTKYNDNKYVEKNPFCD